MSYTDEVLLSFVAEPSGGGELARDRKVHRHASTLSPVQTRYLLVAAALVALVILVAGALWLLRVLS